MPPSKTEDIRRAEAERKSKDLWTVFNPTNQDMEVLLNVRVSPERWTIPANKEEIVPAYVADMYADKMSDQIIYNKSDKAVIEENEKRLAKGFNKMDIHTEQARFESRNLKTMMSKRDKLRAILIVGLYKEYGVGDGTEAFDKEFQRQNLKTDSSVDSALGITSPDTPQSGETPVKASQDADLPGKPEVAPQKTRAELDAEAKKLGMDTSKMKTKKEVEHAISNKVDPIK